MQTSHNFLSQSKTFFGPFISTTGITLTVTLKPSTVLGEYEHNREDVSKGGTFGTLDICLGRVNSDDG